jgi:hypothetical protein
MLKVVVINGSAECGKDEFIQFIQSKWDNYHIINASTIDPSKAALKILGWDGVTKNKETRQAMVDLKRISMKLFNGPFLNIIELINFYEKQYNGQDRGIYFIHCREPEEIQKFVDYYKESCITLLIRSHRGKALKNGSDDVVENYDYDHTIDNNGSLEELEQKAILFANNNLI